MRKFQKKKLVLSKETLRWINEEQANQIAGGGAIFEEADVDHPPTYFCWTWTVRFGVCCA